MTFSQHNDICLWSTVNYYTEMCGEWSGLNFNTTSYFLFTFIITYNKLSNDHQIYNYHSVHWTSHYSIKKTIELWRIFELRKKAFHNSVERSQKMWTSNYRIYFRHSWTHSPIYRTFFSHRTDKFHVLFNSFQASKLDHC